MITREELRRLIKAGPMRADELDALFQSCPEWVAEQKEREAKWAAERLKLVAQQAPMLIDFAKVGWRVKSVWDFVNMKDSYPTVIPVLLFHLDKSYSPRVREGIIRALTVVEARGAPARRVLEELKNSGNQPRNVRWALANALTVIADQSMADELSEMAADTHYDDIMRVIREAAVKATKRKLTKV